MAFVKFTHANRSYTPRFTLTRTGLLSFSQAAREKCKIDDYTHAVLYYDADAKRIGVILTNNKGEEGATKIRLRSTGGDIAAKAFCAYFEIDIAETRQYHAHFAEGMIVIGLTDGRVRRKRGPHAE